MDVDVSSVDTHGSVAGLLSTGIQPVVIAPNQASGVHVVSASTGQVIQPSVITVDNPKVSVSMS